MVFHTTDGLHDFIETGFFQAFQEKKSTKQATKGQKQIVEENVATLSFYRNMSVAAVAIYLLFCGVFWSTTSSFDIALICLSAFAQFCCYRFMAYMAKAKYSETGQLLDGGIDLNMESGISEHIKDAIILTSATEVLSSISSYFWLILLVVPCRLFHMAWTNFLSPWFFQKAPSPEQDAQEDKKKRKLERRIKRQQH
uniref:Transmembrane protein 208 n=1 Tax=Daphnia lumholtzi TaxID=42856 RepID=A0A4Y7M8A8_9CRUS|nr:EOG090X0IGL [Daphnia lumholtzi]SVE77977.1 EOG090X0IGL [Daphnia lumholtzi]SVE78606.1 EOG090X0IGL [Daphnia lumholtzi]